MQACVIYLSSWMYECEKLLLGGCWTTERQEIVSSYRSSFLLFQGDLRNKEDLEKVFNGRRLVT